MAHLDLYHRTTPEAAQAILRDKRMDSKERGDVFFSTHRGGDNSSGYGSAVVHVRVPEHLAELDDEFPNGEQHYRVNNRSLKPHHFVGVHQRRTSSLSTGAWVHAKVCPCGEQLVKQPGEDWWSHLDGSISHDHGGSVSDLLRTALPTKRIFGPTFGLDHRLFDGDQLKPDVTHYVLSTLDGFWRPRYGAGWRRWARVYLAGSEASEWTSATQEGNNDFDVLIGVHYARAREDVPAFLALSPEQITDRLNAEFRTGLMPYTSGEHEVWIPVRTGVMQRSSAWVDPSYFPLNNGSNSSPTTEQGPRLPRSANSSASTPRRSAGISVSPEFPVVRADGPQRGADVPSAGSAPRHPSRHHTAPASPARRGTSETDTSESTTESRPPSSTSSSRSREAAAGSASSDRTTTWTTGRSITTTGAAPGSGPAGSASGASSAAGATTPSATSAKPIFAPRSRGLTAESLPPLPDGYEWVGPLDSTFYVNPNSWDIRDIKPYAAYDITNHEWAVKPPHLPDWDVSKFPEGHALVEMGEAYERLIQAIFDLPEPYRTQQGNALWTYLHTDRSRAFGPNGEGWYDPGNVIEKWLDQDGMWKDLWDIHHRADEDPSTLLAPANWSNDPRG